MEELKSKVDIRNMSWEIIHEEKIHKIPFVNIGQNIGEEVIAVMENP